MLFSSGSNDQHKLLLLLLFFVTEFANPHQSDCLLFSLFQKRQSSINANPISETVLNTREHPNVCPSKIPVYKMYCKLMYGHVGDFKS